MKRILLLLILIVLAVAAALYFTGNLPWLEEVVNPQPQTTMGDDPRCGYVWATQPLPDVTAELQKKLIKLELKATEVNAAAYGENCVLADGSVDSFIIMQTDLYFKVPVADFEDLDLLGGITRDIILFVDDIQPDTLPGPQRGYIQVNFVSADGEMQSLWFRQTEGKAALDDGLLGAGLYKELLNK